MFESLLQAPPIFSPEEIRGAAERELAHWAEHGCGTPIIAFGCCELAQATQGQEHDSPCWTGEQK